MNTIVPITVQDLINLHNYFVNLKDPSAIMIEAKEKIEQQIKHFTDSLKTEAPKQELNS